MSHCQGKAQFRLVYSGKTDFNSEPITCHRMDWSYYYFILCSSIINNSVFLNILASLIFCAPRQDGPTAGQYMYKQHTSCVRCKVNCIPSISEGAASAWFATGHYLSFPFHSHDFNLRLGMVSLFDVFCLHNKIFLMFFTQDSTLTRVFQEIIIS